MTQKALVFDSSSIITLALNSMLNILEPLKKEFNGKFLITPQVHKEIIDNPLKQKRFELEALLISGLVKKGILEIASPKDLSKETDRIIKTANSVFSVDNENMKILHEGEASCFALAELLKPEYETVLVIDERTARMLAEKPQNLHKLLGKKLHKAIYANKSLFSSFSGLDIIRSSELLLVAYKKGIINLPASSEQAVDALLYASKFKGCSISFSEIERAKELI